MGLTVRVDELFLNIGQ